MGNDKKKSTESNEPLEAAPKVKATSNSKRIEVGNGFIIDVDSMSYTIKKGYNAKTHDDSACTVVGYYGTFETALHRVKREVFRLKLKKINSLNEAIEVAKKVNSTYNLLESKIGPVPKK
jgi:hypothetical protein